MRLPEYISFVINRVNAHGEQAFVVGGACRDVLLGLIPHDYDLATSATPNQLKTIFHDFKLVLMGEAFGTVGVVIDSHLVELTTYRVEGGYLDHRHPSDLTYTKHLDDDLARRDFTINAMAFHPSIGWIDRHQGKEDLNAGIIRLVGDAHQRMREDALRALRALRFASRYGFQLEPKTEQAVREHLPAALRLSTERVYNEWKAILIGPYAPEMITRYQLELRGLLPAKLTSDKLELLHQLADNFALRMAALLRPEEVDSWWSTWKGDKKSWKVVHALQTACSQSSPRTKQEVHRWLTQVPLDFRDTALPLWIHGTEHEEMIRQWHEDLVMNHAPLSVRDLAINGHDLHRLSVPHSLRAQLLERLLAAVIAEEVLNRHSELLNMVPLLVAKISDEKIK